VVRDQPSLSKANDFYLVIKGLRKKIADTFDPIIYKAHAAHKEALTQKSLIEASLVTAEKYLNGQVTAYHQEIEKKRREEEEIARQKAIKEEMERRKAEEEARIAQAAELEAAGATEEAEALMVETIEENEKPMEVYIPPPTTQKVDFSARVVDMKKLIKAVAEGRAPVNCLEANATVLNGLARSLKREMKIDGVELVEIASMAATGRKYE
jgi:dGTP triphosphohydrolase